MPCCRFDTHLVYLSYSVRGVPPSLCDRPWQVVWKREQAFCKCQLNLSYCFAVFSCDGPHFFASPTSALCNACLETRLAKWREKEGLIKFIMNCRRVHKGEEGCAATYVATALCRIFTLRDALSSFISILLHFATISKIAARCSQT